MAEASRVAAPPARRPKTRNGLPPLRIARWRFSRPPLDADTNSSTRESVGHVLVVGNLLLGTGPWAWIRDAPSTCLRYLAPNDLADRMNLPPSLSPEYVSVVNSQRTKRESDRAVTPRWGETGSSAGKGVRVRVPASAPATYQTPAPPRRTPRVIPWVICMREPAYLA